MNKYIDYDIHNGLTQLKCAIMNILKALDFVELDYYKFSPEISEYLVIECMKESGWKQTNETAWFSPHSKFYTLSNLTLRHEANL